MKSWKPAKHPGGHEYIYYKYFIIVGVPLHNYFLGTAQDVSGDYWFATSESNEN